MVESIGNDRFNAIWEGALQHNDKSSDSYAAEIRSGSRPQKPDGDAGRDVKEEWVRLKYVDRAFLAGPVRILASQPELMQQVKNFAFVVAVLYLVFNLRVSIVCCHA